MPREEPARRLNAPQQWQPSHFHTNGENETDISTPVERQRERRCWIKQVANFETLGETRNLRSTVLGFCCILTKNYQNISEALIMGYSPISGMVSWYLFSSVSEGQTARICFGLGLDL